MNNALTADDLSDLLAVTDGVCDPSGARRSLRRSELDDGGDRLLGLGLVYVSAPGWPGIPASARLEATDAGLDELFERERAARLRRAAHARLAAYRAALAIDAGEDVESKLAALGGVRLA